MLPTLLSIFLPSLAYPLVYAAPNMGSQLPLHSTLIDVSVVCREIASAVSSASGVFFPGTEEYAKDIYHYAITSTQEAACSFEPGTPKDVGIALQILGRSRCPFAVKCGGHTMNPGFSSTSGVQIAMHRFSDVVYDSITQTVKVGAGLIWDDVYAALEPYGVNVAGGRVPGIGVGGFTLGGGYSWHANQHGLTLDTVEAFEVVLPNGTVTNVDVSQPDLFFGLKGGINNFGIVTHFTFKAFPQTQVWGGSIKISPSKINEFTVATANFAANNTDPKANMITTYGYMKGDGFSESFGSAMLFYDAPLPPAGLFDDFLSISDKVEAFTRTFLSLVQAPNTGVYEGSRMAFNTISVLGYPEDFLQYLRNESIHWGTNLPLDPGYIHFNVHPFLPNVYDHATTPSAWPASRAFFSPLNIALGWKGDGTTDDAIINGMEEVAINLRASTAVSERLPLYPNYALPDAPLDAIYGSNLERLRRITREVDPENVMGLTGGFKF